MSAVEAAFLGFVQGLTEFLPVSSSGHLVLFQQFFDIAGDDVLFDLVLHLGTLVPVMWFYRAQLAEVFADAAAGAGPWAERPGVRLLGLLVVATIPTGVIGLTFEDLFVSLFARPAVLTLTFAITGAILFLTRNRPDGDIDLARMTWRHAAILGIAQGLAITPGISRSGTTIAVALLLGLRRDLAAKMSFLMSVPAILGALVLQSRDIDWDTFGAHGQGVDLAIGGAVALVSGYLALSLLVYIVNRGRVSTFAYYCWFAAVVAGAIAVYRA